MRRVVIQRESSGRSVRVRAANGAAATRANPYSCRYCGAASNKAVLVHRGGQTECRNVETCDARRSGWKKNAPSAPRGAVECSGCGAIYKSAAYAQAHVNKCPYLDSPRPRGPLLRSPRSPRKPSRNAIMMTIGRPNPGASLNKSTKSFKEYTLPIDQVKMTPKLQEAIERWEMFQDGAKAQKVRIYEYDDGKEGVDERVCFRVGESQITIDTVEDVNGNEIKIKPLDIGMVYKGEKSAKNKAGAQWIHSYREDGGKPPVAVVDVETGVLMHIGGTYEALDWMRR